jgi:hypothetical protein
MPTCLLRLNYAVECHHGVPADLAKRGRAGGVIPPVMNHVNVIWQGDANSITFRALELADSPAEILNVIGPSSTQFKTSRSLLPRISVSR